MQRVWNTVKTFDQDQFTVELSWCYEDLPLSYVFETEEDIALHQLRCEDYTDTHYVARVCVLYDGKVLGAHCLGSCYAYGCSPEDDFNNGLDGFLEDMIEAAMDEARTEAVRMLDRLKADFLEKVG